MIVGSANWVGQQVAGGRYHVTAKLGEGGMGHVYQARDNNLDCDVVLKVPRPSMLEDPEFAGRFAREIRSLVRLAHPHIVKVSDVGSFDDLPFAVLQYLSGGSLRMRQGVDVEGNAIPMHLGAFRAWLEPIAGALDFIHKQGYIHRDVKPENILFDAHGHPYLADFGVAKVLADKTDSVNRTFVTGAGMVLGTPHYMAPELVLGEPYDGRIDQYALGVVAYELLSGSYPYDGPTAVAIFLQHKSGEALPLEDVAPGASAATGAVVRRALAKDPKDRFPNCLAFAQALLETAESLSARKGPGSKSSLSGPQISCPQCSKNLTLPLDSWGKRLRCPGCKTIFDAPANPGALGSPATLRGIPVAADSANADTSESPVRNQATESDSRGPRHGLHALLWEWKSEALSSVRPWIQGMKRSVGFCFGWMIQVPFWVWFAVIGGLIVAGLLLSIVFPPSRHGHASDAVGAPVEEPPPPNVHLREAVP